MQARARGEEPPENGYQGDYVLEIAGELPGAGDLPAAEVSLLGIELMIARAERSLAGFRVLFEAACFELQQIFENGPPRVTFTIADSTLPPRLVKLDGGNPYEIELRRFVDCMAGRADSQMLDAERAIEALTLSLEIRRALSAARGAGS